MTAEVAIINNQAVALAADSAVTIGRERVWKHANKIFSAGPHNDIGIMIYNTGDFQGIPWETIIKEFRRKCGSVSYSTVIEYSEDFVEFISSQKLSDKQSRLSIQLIIIDIFENLRNEINCDKRKDFDSELPSKLVSEIAYIETESEILDQTLEFKLFKKDFKTDIIDLTKDIFGFRPKSKDIEDLCKLVYTHVTYKSESEYATGVVVAGYGRDEMFPVVCNYTVDGRWRNLTRVWSSRSVDFNEADPPDAGILPFAQSDMASLFVEGVYPRYKIFLEQFVRGILQDKSEQIVANYVPVNEMTVERSRQSQDNDTIVSELLNDFGKYRRNSFIKPLMQTVAALPKEEMAFMAKAIVELTALRRKFTSAVESVGGAIDVAIISKGDGFIWIDRKHYFGIEYNSDFLDRKILSRGGK